MARTPGGHAMETEDVQATRQRRFVRRFLAIVIAIAAGALIALPIVAGRSLHHGVAGSPRPVSAVTFMVQAAQPPVSPTAAMPNSSTTPQLPIAAGPCSEPSTLSISQRPLADAAGNHYTLWTVANSGVPCTLTGYPILVERNAEGAIAPAITTVDAPGMSVTPATVASATSTASFWVDSGDICDQLPAEPYFEPHTVAVSFAGLSSPVIARLPQAFGFCSPTTMVVSPITQGVATIPGFSTGGTPPAGPPPSGPPKSPGAKP